MGPSLPLSPPSCLRRGWASPQPASSSLDPASPEKSLQTADRSSPARGWRQEGGERGRLGPKDGIPYHTASRPPVSNQRLPEILDGRHLLRGSQRDTGRRHPTGGRGLGLGTRRAEGACTDWCGWKLRLGSQRGEGAPRPGRARPSSAWLPEPLGQGRHKKQAQLFVLHFCGAPKGWNRAQRRARSI